MSAGRQTPDPNESRGAVALTIAWMLTCMCTAVGVLLVLALRLLMLAFPAAADRLHPLSPMAGVFLFVAMATGGLCLLLTPLVLRVRAARPPRAVTIGAVLIAAAPFVLLALLSVL